MSILEAEPRTVLATVVVTIIENAYYIIIMLIYVYIIHITRIRSEIVVLFNTYY